MDDSNPTPTTRVSTPSLEATEEAASTPPPPSESTFGAPPPATPPPSWSQPRKRDRDGGRIWTLVVGLFILALGVWFFLERTLGLDLPTIRWSQLWPVILIVIGAVVLLGALRRERR
jgi:uncharacterized integral membrane protein